MKLISWNVNGIRAIVGKDFVTMIRELNPDVLCLQETKADGAIVREVLSELEEYQIHTREAQKKGYSGTAILSRVGGMPLAAIDQFVSQDSEGRILALDFEAFTLVNVYVPNSGQGLKRLDYRAQWDKDFAAYLQRLGENKPVILCGDLNVSHQSIDLKNDKANYNKTAGYTQKEIDGMDNLLASGFKDSFREMHPQEEKYSYWSYRFGARKRNVGWRLDYFLVSNNLWPKVKQAYILNEYMGSDHCPVGIDLDL